MDRSEGERRGARRPSDQPETEGSRPSRSRRSVTGSAEALTQNGRGHPCPCPFSMEDGA